MECVWVISAALVLFLELFSVKVLREDWEEISTPPDEFKARVRARNLEKLDLKMRLWAKKREKL